MPDPASRKIFLSNLCLATISWLLLAGAIVPNSADAYQDTTDLAQTDQPFSLFSQDELSVDHWLQHDHAPKFVPPVCDVPLVIAKFPTNEKRESALTSDSSKLKKPTVSLVSYVEDVQPASATIEEKDDDPETLDDDLEFQFAGQLKQHFEDKFIYPLPVELIDWLSNIAEQQEAELKDAESDEDKAKLITIEQAIARMRRTKLFEADIVKIRQETEDAPRLIQQAETKFSEPLPPLNQVVKDSDTVEQTEANLAEQREEVNAANENLQQAEAAIKERNARLAAFSEQRKQARSRLEESLEQLGKLGFDSSATPEGDVLTQVSIAILSSIETEKFKVESERDTAVAKLYSLQRDNAKRLAIRAEEVRNLVNEKLANQRRMEKEQLARETRLEAAKAHPSVRELAEHNVELAERSTEMTQKIQAAHKDLDDVKQKLDELDVSFKKIENKVEVAGTTQTVGMLLRKFRRHLPSISKSYSRVTQIKTDLPTLQLALIEFEEQREQLNAHRALLQNPDTNSRDTVFIDTNLITGEQKQVKIEPEVREMALKSLEKQGSLLDQLVVDYEKAIELLSELELQTRSLVERTNETRFYIDKHVLWIRSTQPMGINDLPESVKGLRSVLAVQQWSDLSGVIVGWFKSKPYYAMFAFMFFVGLITFRGRLRARLRNINANPNLNHISPLLRSLFLSFLIAAIYPSVIIVAGFMLRSPYDTASLKGAASFALLLMAPQVLIASFLYQISGCGGLAETRLGWNPGLTKTLRRLVTMMAFFCFPLMFIFQFMNLYSDGKWESSLGRIALIISMVVLGLANMRAFRGVFSFLQQATHSSIKKLIMQWRWLWLLLFVVGPIALAAFAAMGYAYSAVQLGGRIMLTFWLALITIFGYSLISRIALIAEKTIASSIRRRRIIESAENRSTEDNHEEEIANINRQIDRLLRFSAIAFALIAGWQLWSPILPAVQVLDQVQLWQATTYVAETSVDNSNVASEVMVAKRVDITLNHALICGVFLGLTYVLSRNLPGLLEIAFLNRLPIDRGGKYAISIVLRYLVAITGSIFAFRMIGFSWDSVHWLVAAMSVGLGFGLQEIFANFVSGLIILLERPVRVGDMVVVNGTTGWVTRIQLRATTITDLDRREIIVPNKKFITDDVINWTLTDSITRIVIPVGVAYGSDTKLAQETLLKVAYAHQSVLRVPAPAAHFTAFGSSSLDFELRVFIPNREMFYELQHELHMLIDKAFREVDIEIAFPQQDLHIRSGDLAALGLGPKKSEPAADQNLRKSA